MTTQEIISGADRALPDRFSRPAPTSGAVRVTPVLQATTGRLYPTTAQAQRMARIGGQCRALWNHWVATSAERYAAEGK